MALKPFMSLYKILINLRMKKAKEKPEEQKYVFRA